MAPVKVFGPAMSPNVARVLVCLEEVGAEYEVVNIDFKVVEHKSPEHLARNVRKPPPSPASSWFF
jgi:glutathione S-transferase